MVTGTLTPLRRAMVLAAGFGVRMKPLTDRIPKPMVNVGGKALIDHVLDRLLDAGVEQAVVNVHYLADVLTRHLAGRRSPEIVISDERGQLLETGGGVVKALPLIGPEPFFHVNSDTIWIDGVKPNLLLLAEAFDRAHMDALLLLAPTISSIVYSGAAIFSPALFTGAPSGAFSLTRLFDRAEEAGRLHGLRLDGTWMHVGTPDAVAEAEKTLLVHTA